MATTRWRGLPLTGLSGVRLISGGIIALHDTVLKPDQPKRSELGSHRYFQSDIRHDPDFEVVAQIDSLSVLAKN